MEKRTIVLLSGERVDQKTTFGRNANIISLPKELQKLWDNGEDPASLEAIENWLDEIKREYSSNITLVTGKLEEYFKNR
jgi:KaiC/GvpD/RAD55 family RecA-like ATPase